MTKNHSINTKPNLFHTRTIITNRWNIHIKLNQISCYFATCTSGACIVLSQDRDIKKRTLLYCQMLFTCIIRACSRHISVKIKCEAWMVGHKMLSALWFVEGIVHLQWLVDFPILIRKQCRRK